MHTNAQCIFILKQGYEAVVESSVPVVGLGAHGSGAVL